MSNNFFSIHQTIESAIKQKQNKTKQSKTKKKKKRKKNDMIAVSKIVFKQEFGRKCRKICSDSDNPVFLFKISPAPIVQINCMKRSKTSDVNDNRTDLMANFLQYVIYRLRM